ncbi:MAG: DUF3644 domain-containing protein [Methylovirgula sp.]
MLPCKIIPLSRKHKEIKPTGAVDLDEFLACWPDIDPQTGLSLKGDELLIKAREAIIAAVHIFNGAGLYFRAELFIVTAIIAWTYLQHAYFKREGIDYRYTKLGTGAAEITRHGAEKFWELGKCLSHPKCPVEKGARQNLEFLLELRHEIEHRLTSRIDDQISAKLQACCINFNDLIKRLFGSQFGLEKRLPIALQFVTFSSDQRATLKRAASMPRHIETLLADFQGQMTAEEINDPAFAYRVAFVQKVANHASLADEAVEFIRPGSEQSEAINRVLLKEVEKSKYLPKQIVRMMHDEGYTRFTMTDHTDLWRMLSAKDPKKGYGVKILNGQWCWYETWLTRVREHCRTNAAKFGKRRAPPPPEVSELPGA